MPKAPRDNNRIEYYEEDGALWFSYRSKIETAHLGTQHIDLDQKIPDEIITQGSNAIKAYAQDMVKNRRDWLTARIAEREKFCNNPNVPVSTTIDGVLLEGTITGAAVGYIIVTLQAPLTGEKWAYRNWHGPYLFAGDTTLSRDAIALAKKTLVEIYREAQYRQQHETIFNLADELNRG